MLSGEVIKFLKDFTYDRLGNDVEFYLDMTLIRQQLYYNLRSHPRHISVWQDIQFVSGKFLQLW